MTAVEFKPEAVEMLDRLIVTHSLPGDTWPRVINSVGVLAQFPQSGPTFRSRRDGLRFIVGPWRWMLLIYRHVEDEDRVAVVSIQDGRSATPIA